jgi:predicted Zn finger-like uncharacterized protein
LKMRLICPNCGAQYEVADDVIPVAGRDVQCSNCGHTWFEHPGASEAAEAGEPLPPPEAVSEAVPEVEPEPVLEVAEEPEPAPLEIEPPEIEAPDMDVPPEPVIEQETMAVEQAPEPADDSSHEPVDNELDEQTVLTAVGLQRRSLSPDLAEILRQEAEHEAAARAAEGPPRQSNMPETTADLDDQRSEEARRRMARMRGEPEPVTSTPANPTARRELLPDIEEINSSLRSTTDRDGSAALEPAMQQRKRGARFGFTTIMLLVAILVGLYLGAGRLSTLVPAAEPVLTRYVAVVNDVRLWIDLKMQAFIAGQSGNAAVNDPATSAPAPETPAVEAPATQAPTPETDAPAAPPADQTNG